MDQKKYFIIPLRGSGLWDAIWGYVALEDDMSTIKGIVFDHKGETAGLGAEITQQWFQDRFVGEKIFNSSSKLVGINVSKSNNDPKNLEKITRIFFIFSYNWSCYFNGDFMSFFFYSIGPIMTRASFNCIDRSARN